MRRFLAMLMMLAGVLIAGFAGLCAGAVILSSRSPGDAPLVVMALVISAVPLVIGLGLFLGGFFLGRERRPPQA